MRALLFLGGVLVAAASFAMASGCTPKVTQDPAPAAMEFDTAAKPPRVPQPTSLIINRQTGMIDFSLAGTPLPADCADAPPVMSVAECEFDRYLQTLNGFPTVTPAQTPSSAPLDVATLTPGQNVVVVEARSGSVVNDVTVGFDAVNRKLTVRPTRSWALGGSYWVGVRGYANGVRTVDGRQVVGSPTQFLLKQETPLTCGAAAPADLDPRCPAAALLLQNVAPDDQASREAVARSVFQLEAIRQGYLAGWTLMNDVGGLPKTETAVLWNFIVHSASVPELDPTVPLLVPRATAADEIRVAVQGSVDPATVKAVVFTVSHGSVVLMDLTAAQTGNAPGSFPLVEARFSDGEIIIKGQAPFVRGHQYGLFFDRDIRNLSGQSLVPSPVSVLLRLRAPLVEDGHSAISTVGDADAIMLEAGRQQLAGLFDSPSFFEFTGMTREELSYCFVFPFLFGGAS